MRKRAGLLAGLLVVALGSGAVAQSPSPTPDWQRIEYPTEGFAISLPSSWDHVVAAEADPDGWFVGHAHLAPEEWKADFLAYGGFMVARLPSPFTTCDTYDYIDFVGGPEVLLSLAEEVELFMALEDDPTVVDITAEYLGLPAGEAAYFDIRWMDGSESRDYVVTDGRVWFKFACSSDEPPDDRWLSIAETIEFLPVEE